MAETNELTDIEVDEISAVDRPASPGARAVIYKRAGGPPAAGARRVNLNKSLAGRLGMEAALPAAVPQLPGNDPIVVITKADKGTVLVRKDYANAAMQDAGQQADSGVGGVLQALHEHVSEALDAVAKGQAQPDEAQQAIDQGFTEAAQMLDQQLMGDEQDSGLLEKCFIGGVLSTVPAEEAETIRKAAGSAAQAATQDGEGDAGVASAEVLALQKRVQELEAREADIIKNAGIAAIETRLRKAGQPLALASTLFDVKKAQGDEALEKILKAYEAAGVTRVQKSQGLVRELGDAGQTAHAAIITKRDETIRKLQESDPKLSYQQAFSKALRIDPELAAAYDRGELA